ncbi:MAG: Gfo/Idh/MocA family oxidoreductase [Verrucomicrobiae bacterium]|nr:Gfo/Idh/MocA family oxidoreductase [Verrucomicrobiae bacterium]
MRQNRREFMLAATRLGSLAAASSLLRSSMLRAEDRRFRAAIIGDTSRGGYGHGLDMIFAQRANVEVVAVADPSAEGRQRAAGRTGAQRQYADYHEMLAKEQPDLVSVAPRWTDQHHAMAMAALRHGAHLFMEKPITRTLAQADEVLALASQANLKIAVAHQMRLAPNLMFLQQRLAAGLIGDVLEIRAHGKQDHRAGGEDVIVLGVHLFDLMRFFAGEPQWCSARVLHEGRDITLQDARPATEDIGPVAGDTILAQFAFDHGVNASFTSRRHNRTAGPWGLELIGSRGAVRILADIFPRIYKRNDWNWSDTGLAARWQPIDGDPTANWTRDEQSVQRANQRLADDWLAAIRSNREPACSGADGMRALEMAHAVFAAGLSGSRVKLPLVNREHPLAKNG